MTRGVLFAAVVVVFIAGCISLLTFQHSRPGTELRPAVHLLVPDTVTTITTGTTAPQASTTVPSTTTSSTATTTTVFTRDWPVQP